MLCGRHHTHYDTPLYFIGSPVWGSKRHSSLYPSSNHHLQQALASHLTSPLNLSHGHFILADINQYSIKAVLPHPRFRRRPSSDPFTTASTYTTSTLSLVSQRTCMQGQGNFGQCVGVIDVTSSPIHIHDSILKVPSTTQTKPNRPWLLSLPHFFLDDLPPHLLPQES